MAGRKLSNRRKPPPDLIRPSRSEPQAVAAPPRIALSIVEFCELVGISEDFFYKLKRQREAPRMMKVGSRTMITVQAANQWCIEREAEAEAAGKVEA